ncbi:hypothetical protein HYC85_016461 [Camellia sinensis]|uniref:Uncharacterized protein n=1 Tax=Camellia sinensis TaxID=4442 RepID=A0A7J7GZP7_CAMSI|nr:hypothetical protein HYC85_016461 [Camellia sinensis]
MVNIRNVHVVVNDRNVRLLFIATNIIDIGFSTIKFVNLNITSTTFPTDILRYLGFVTPQRCRLPLSSYIVNVHKLVASFGRHNIYKVRHV